MEFNSRRSPVFSAHGIVATSQPLASRIGAQILDRGGNAADAAVAIAAALNTLEPTSTGIGGDAFCLFYDAAEATVKGLNASGRAPAALTIDILRNQHGITGDSIPSKNINAVTVPGAAAGWVDTISMFGSGKLTLAQILQPAIDLAEEGYPVAPHTAYFWRRSEDLLKTASPDGADMLKRDRDDPSLLRAPRAGEIMKMPNLARTFRRLASDGKNGFYSGPVAEAIVQLVTSKGGVMTLDDLLEHTSTPITPISYTYREGSTLHECPPNGQGLTALIALGIIDALQEGKIIPDLSTIPHNSAQYLHILIECMRIAFADARYHIADPGQVAVPTEQLLSKEYLRSRAALFNPQEATVDVSHGSPTSSSDTVYFCVVDKQGNACSFINSNYEGFGTGAVPHGCGFTLQNRGSNFSLDAAHPNGLAPRKRPYHTIIPGMITRLDGEGRVALDAAMGVMGGFMQPQGHLQVFLNMKVYHMDAQAALDALRFCITPDAAAESFVDLEAGIAADVVEELRGMGHKIRVRNGMERALFGRGQIIRVLDDGVLEGGSDPRADGMAIGL